MEARQTRTFLQEALQTLQEDSVLLHPSDSISATSKRRRFTLQHLVNRFYWQIRYGCQDPSCSTPTCLSCRRRVARAPLRPFTLLSAKALAAFLAEQENPEQALCPHAPALLDSGKSRCQGAARPKKLPNSKTTNRVVGKTQREHQAEQVRFDVGSTDEASTIPKHSDEQQKKDFKSISQNLYDTTAWWVLQSVSHEDGRFTWTGLPGQENPSKRGIMRKPSGSTSDFASSDDSEAHRVLPHFSAKNIIALATIVRSVDFNLVNQTELIKGLGLSKSSLTQAPLSPEARFWYRYAHQSMVHIFSSPERLLKSFRSRSGDGRVQGMVDCSQMHSAIGALQTIEGFPQRIFPSLWISLGDIFASYEELKPPKSHFQEEHQPRASSATPIVPLYGQKAAHIVSITIAALNASVPAPGLCHHDFYLFRSLSQNGHPVAHHREFLSIRPQANQAFALLQDAFDDDQAMDLATRMVRLWMTHRALERSRGQRSGFTMGVIGKLECPSRPERSLLDVNSLSLYEKINGYESNLQSILLIEWLRQVIFKYWDGKAAIEQTSPVAGAIDWLKFLCKNRSHFGLPSSAFTIQRFFNKMDPIETAIAWESSTSDALHILSFPFLLPRQAWITYFRAINHASMKRAYDASRTAARCMINLRSTFRGPNQRLLERMDPITNTLLVLDVRRGNILTDAIDQLWRRDRRELQRPLKVQLGMDEGELGVDQGGIQQEFFRLAMAEAFDPDYGLFTTTDSTSKMSWFQPGSLEPLYKYEMLGLLTSLAVYNGLTLPFTFPMLFYMKLLGKRATKLDDISDGWPELRRGLKELWTWEGDDVEDVFVRSFIFESPAPGGGTFSVDLVQLCKDHGAPWPGEEYQHSKDSEPPMVTNENKQLFVETYIQALTQFSVAPQLDAFHKGFFTLISHKSLSLFEHDPASLKTLVEGEPASHATAAELRKHCTYEAGFTPESATVVYFWDVVENEYDTEMLGKLLEFVTSSARVAVQGVGHMAFGLQRNGSDEARIPGSSTCYSKLLLPEYRSKEVLRERMKVALENSQGFGSA